MGSLLIAKRNPRLIMLVVPDEYDQSRPILPVSCCLDANVAVLAS